VAEWRESTKADGLEGGEDGVDAEEELQRGTNSWALTFRLLTETSLMLNAGGDRAVGKDDDDGGDRVWMNLPGLLVLLLIGVTNGVANGWLRGAMLGPCDHTQQV
jgi:hypothetical protein